MIFVKIHSSEGWYLWERRRTLNMAKSKTIKKYRTEIIDNVIIEIPVRDEESKDIIELNFKQYVDVLADIVVRYVANFKAGQAVGLHLCLL